MASSSSFLKGIPPDSGCIFEQIPLSMSPELLHAESLLQAKSYPAAHDAFRALVVGGTEENNPNAVHDLAICCFHLKRMEEALSWLDRAVELQPDYGYRFASRAWMRAAAKQFEGARADYKRAIALDPEDAVSHNNLGLLEEQLGYQMQAQERFRVADELQGMFKENGMESEMPKPAPVPSIDTTPTPELPTSMVRIMWWALSTSPGRQAFLAFLAGGWRKRK